RCVTDVGCTAEVPIAVRRVHAEHAAELPEVVVGELMKPEPRADREEEEPSARGCTEDHTRRRRLRRAERERGFVERQVHVGRTALGTRPKKLEPPTFVGRR